MSGNYAFVADSDAGLQVIDVSDPTNPLRRGSLDTSGTAQGIAVSGNYAFLDREFAAALTRSFEADKTKSQRLTAEAFRNRSAVTKFIDHFFGLFRAQL